MTFVVSRPRGVWELRTSTATPRGPRSRTLVSFRELNARALQHALDRSSGGLTAAEIRDAASRAGAPVAPEPARRAAAQLIAELAGGATLPEGWKPVLDELLAGGDGHGGSADVIGEWADAGLERRGEALRDLLLLADAIPSPPRQEPLAFPGFSSR